MILTIAFTLFALPLANAQFTYNADTQAAINAGMKWDIPYQASATRLLLWNRWKDKIPTFVYVVPSPNPVGVGQSISFIMMNPQVPNDALDTNDIRYQYSLKIDKPNGETETLPPPGATSGVYNQYIKEGRFISDSTGSAYTMYTPDQVGNYTVTITFHELFYRWNDTNNQRNYYGVTLKESKYTTTFVVQEEQVMPKTWTPVPLPTEYWARPIEGQNTEWWRIASNWYNNVRDRNNDGTENRYQPDGTAPNSGHILWTKPVEDGGLVGGGNFSVQGEVYNAGHQYQTRMDGNTIIMNGKLYYLGPRYWSGDGDIFRAVDLKTGQTIWEQNITGVGAPTFGYMWDWDDMNQHGVVNPGWLFTNNFDRAYHPLYGDITTLSLTNVPSLGSYGFTQTTSLEAAGPKGEILRYVVDGAGWLAQWNSSKVIDSDNSGKIPANVPTTPARPSNMYWNGSMWVSNSVRTAQGYASATSPSYDWNVSAPWLAGMSSVTIRAVIRDDILLGTNGSHPVGTGSITYAYPDEVTFWAISLKPNDRGRVVWMKNIKTAGFSDNHITQFRKAAEGVFIMIELPYQLPIAYSMYTGELLWKGTEAIADYNPFGYYGYPSLINVYTDKIAYGKYFSSGYSGMVFAYDLQTGELLWRYEAPTGMGVFKYYTLMPGVIADGKIYVGTHEHSADTPLFKGARIRALDVDTGEEVWTMAGWAYPGTFAVADGTLVYWNNYDHQIYAVGKGPSSTTVDAPLAAITQGSGLVIRGTVTDISAGTQQPEQSARFPKGVPAVSDASQSAWMEYVYMQKPLPMDTVGVDVVLSVLDPNGNYYDIGNATSDASGTYSLLWEPPVPGKYTVIARFAGSESYWPSYAQTAFGVVAAPQATATTLPVLTLPPTELYFAASTAAIIAAIAIVGLLLLKKRP
jgi:outer membrane protein assembly factor BamB